MVEVNTMMAGAGAGFQQASNVTAFIFLIMLLCGVIIGVIAFFVYRSKFNIDIIYVPFNDQPVITGLKARDYFVKGKDYRFKIWAAKRHKLKYNVEAIEPSQITIHKTASGKVRRLIWMTSDSSGLLVPMTVKPETITYTLKKIDEGGKEVKKEVKSTVLQAKYGDVDEAWSSVETEKWTHIFRPQDTKIMWIFVVLCIILVLTLGGFLWGVNKNSDVAQTNAVIAEKQAESNALMVEALCVITEKCLNSTNPSTGKPFNSIIVT